MHLQAGTEYIWHGITWATGTPTLLVANTETRTLEQIAVMDLDLGIKVVATDRFCTGRYRFVDTVRVEPEPCPTAAPATTGGQCVACLHRDEFRFAHHVHTGGPVPAALEAYIAQPHWLYIATFAGGLSKVGTAAAPRKTSRLNEQGPVRATYLAEVADGRAVRHLEDTLTHQAGLAQSVRPARKLAALADLDPEHTHTAHAAAVVTATEVLAAIGVATTEETWTPPDEAGALLSPQGQQRAIYPHDLRDGEHGLRIESCAGSQVLARISADSSSEAVRYVADLNAVKGRRIVTGHFTSPETAVQTALF